MNRSRLKVALITTLLCLGALALADAFLSRLPSPPSRVVSTVPANGDVNPYGVAFVPPMFHGEGKLHTGDILVSNFNNSSNLQGTGTTIVRVTPAGKMSTFFHGSAGLGLTTALGVVRGGFVLVGNVPTTDGTSSTVSQGSLLVLDSKGNIVDSLSDANLLDGPWDLTVRQGRDRDDAQVFVSNVLSGTVTRLDLEVLRHHVTVKSATQIASGYTHHADPAALEVGPTGLAFDEETHTLYVASTGDNAIYAVPDAGQKMTDAGTGSVVYSDNAHLRGPLGLVIAPNGHLIATNGGAVNPDPTQPSEMVEFTKSGQFVFQQPVNATAQGGAFGIAIKGDGDESTFAAVDDIANSLDIWHVRGHRP